MSNYDHDVLGVGNFEHPANEREEDGMNFYEAMDSLKPEQRDAIEGEFIEREAAYKRRLKKLDKAKELMQAIVDAKQVMMDDVVTNWGEANKNVNKAKWNKAYFTVQQKEEELKNLLLGL